MKEKFASIVGMFTALLAGACCIGPALFLALGITGLGFISKMEAFRPYLLGFTFIFVWIAYYYVYGKGYQCGPDGKCNPNIRRINRILFWILVGFAIFGISFPYVSAWLLI